MIIKWAGRVDRIQRIENQGIKKLPWDQNYKKRKTQKMNSTFFNLIFDSIFNTLVH